MVDSWLHDIYFFSGNIFLVSDEENLKRNKNICNGNVEPKWLWAFSNVYRCDDWFIIYRIGLDDNSKSG